MRGTVTRAAASVVALPLLLASGLLAAPAAGHAADQLFPEAQICSQAGADQATVDPLRLIQWLLGRANVSDAALDTNRDGDTLLSEKRLALVDPDYCAAVAAGCSAGDVSALRGLHDDLGEFVATEGGEDYRFERLRHPSAEEQRSAPFLDPAFETDGQEFQIGEVLDVERRFVEIACVEQPPPAIGGPVALGSGREILGWRADPERPGGFRLTSQIDDLSRDRAQLATVRPAQLSINANLEDDTTSYQIAAVAGYDFELERAEDLRSSVIPFLQLERFFDGTTKTTDKLGAGIQAVTTYQSETGASDQIALTPLYLTDTGFDNQIGTFKMRWTPTLSSAAPLPLGFDRTYGPVVLNLSFDGLSDAGRIFNRGGEDSPLEDRGNFFRAGGRIGLRVRGARGTALSQIELHLTNRSLINIGPGPDLLNRFDATLSFLFPDSDNYQISFSYTVGRNDDTLERIELWRTQLGIRF
jgi:hypothetical protein